MLKLLNSVSALALTAAGVVTSATVLPVALGTTSASAGALCVLTADPGGKNPAPTSTGGSTATVGTPADGESFACGVRASATGLNSTAVGNDTVASKAGTTAVGDSAEATNAGASAFGNLAEASGRGSTAVGNKSSATGDETTAVGALSEATSDNATALGNKASATNKNTTAAGQGASASGLAASAYGYDSSATGNFATAVGGSSAADFKSVAIGQKSEAKFNSVAVGQGSFAGAQAVAVGRGASAVARSTAMGYEATADHLNSAAFGEGAYTERKYQQAFGTEENTYTFRGLTSDDSRSAQSGPLEVVTTDAAGNIASDGGALYRDVETAKDGGAVAMAIRTPDFTTDEKFGFSFQYGNWDGASAIGAALQGEVYNNGAVRGALNAGIGYGFNSENVGFTVGGQVTWK